jgi:GH15 family glucan-1,4-alpha-glucosidase
VRRFEAAEQRFARVTGDTLLPRFHTGRARDALSVLAACTYEPTGAAVAAPTTSLPEAPGHDRQFDYRYAWLRDDSLAAAVVSLLGRPDLAAAHLRFIERLDGRLLDAPVFAVDAGQVPDERDVPGVAGWQSSRPVRTGNAAKHQLQYDALGFVLDAIWVHATHGGRLTRRLWSVVRLITDRCAAPPEPATNGIWEMREAADFLSADIGRWVALDRAIRLARHRRPWTRRRHWSAARAAARERVLSELPPDGRLPQVAGGDPDRLDASGLLVVVLGLLDGRDPRAVALVDAHLRRLGTGPWLHRYPPGDDGFAGVEGAFVPCSWWAVAALVAIGRAEEARGRIDALCAALPPLLPEEVDPRTATPLGNTPLIWSHMEMARALWMLEVDTIRRRWGTVGGAAWAVLGTFRLRAHRSFRHLRARLAGARSAIRVLGAILAVAVPLELVDEV